MRKKYITAFLSILVLIVTPISDPFVSTVSAAEADTADVSDVLELNKSDWDTISQRIADANQTAGRRNVDVITGYAIEVPDSILKTLEGKKTTLALHTGNGLAISLTGTDIRSTDRAFRLVLSPEEIIPEAVKQQLIENVVTFREFSMEEKERYPFHVNVHVNLGAENAGKPAMLYYYDEATETLRFMGIFPIAESGYALFGLNRGDEYITVVREGNAYVVKDGEHLSSIARKNGTTLKKLLGANPHITNADVVYPGQVIIIP